MNSEKFIQLNLPCAECIVSAICKDKKRVIKEDDLFPAMFAMKKWNESHKIFRKGLLECWGNMGFDIFSHMRSSDFKDYPHDVSPEFIDLLKELAYTIQWIINSTSWRKGKKFEYDRKEIRLRLEQAISWI